MTHKSPQHRVVVDATAVPLDRGGVGRYVDGVIASLSGDFVIVCQKLDADFYRGLAPGATVLPQGRIARSPLRLIWEQIALPRIARRTSASVIFSPHYTVPLATRLPRVVTFHDATFFSEPRLHTRLKGFFFRRWIAISARVATAVIVPSAATASELERYVRRPVGYVVAHHGVDPAVFHPPVAAEVAKFRNESGLGSVTWVAFLGTIEPRKNLPALVRAYRMLLDRWTDAWGQPPTLAIAGGDGWETELDAEIATLADAGAVLKLGFLDMAQLRAFLGGAQVVSYPSLGEGFGLPVLEAMACGAAVLTTRRLAIPEVGGDTVAYTDVSASSIADGLEFLLANPDERTRLGAAGLRRAASFTWLASAQIHEEVFRRADNESERSQQ